MFHKLSEWYDTYVVSRSDPNEAGRWGEAVRWAETHLGVPAWNRVIVGNHPELLMGDISSPAGPVTSSWAPSSGLERTRSGRGTMS